MSLLKLSDIGTQGTVAGRSITEGAHAVINAASLKQFRKLLDPLKRGKHYHFWTGGQWYLHELVQHLLNQTGRADMWMTTWSISEDAARALMDMRSRGMIDRLTAVFDYKSKETKTKSFLLAKNNFTTTLARVHAKVTVIKNSNWSITLTGSANWTRNPRAERMLLCTVPEAAEYDIEIISTMARGENPFKVK